MEDTYLSIAAARTQLVLLMGLSQPHRLQLGGRHLPEVCDWSLFSLQTNNELEAQRVATEFALRKRIRDLEKAYDELKWQEQNVNVASLVIDHNLGWELNPKGSLLCGRLLGLSMVSTRELLSGACMIPATSYLFLLAQLLLCHFSAAVPDFGLFISPLVSSAVAIKHQQHHAWTV